jgi:hypothetical protein
MTSQWSQMMERLADLEYSHILLCHRCGFQRQCNVGEAIFSLRKDVSSGEVSPERARQELDKIGIGRL